VGQVEIREATVADLGVVAALGRQTYVEHFADRWRGLDLAGWLEAEFGDAALVADFASPGVRYDLAFLGGEPVGYAKTRRDRAVPTTELRGLELKKIYFMRAMVGRGLGSSLLDHVLERADREGEPLVWLDVVKENTGAKALYERFGFAVVGETGNMPENPQLEFWVMVRRTRPSR
jgi:diamine N-acetyltransferase